MSLGTILIIILVIFLLGGFSERFGGCGVIPPFLTGCIRRAHAAIFSFIAGVMPPMPMLGRSLL
jgi:hypothetical protein